jgi:stage II sporulation protein D
MAFPYLNGGVSSRNDYTKVSTSKTGEFLTRTIRNTKDEMRASLEGYYGIKLSDDYLNWIKVEERGAGNVVKTVSIDGQKTVRGVDMMETSLRLDSPNFNLEWAEDGGSVNITVYGLGHGVGLSKAGAEYYAYTQQWDYKRILQYYYPGVELAGINWQV